MKINDIERAKDQNSILRNPQTTITKHYIQIFDKVVYLFVEYDTPFGSNTSIHTSDKQITDYLEWTSLMRKKAEVDK